MHKQNYEENIVPLMPSMPCLNPRATCHLLTFIFLPKLEKCILVLQYVCEERETTKQLNNLHMHIICLITENYTTAVKLNIHIYTIS